jgi:hypothetical protein
MNTSIGNTGSTWTTPKRLLAAALILGSVGVQAAPDTTKGTWWGSDGTDGTLRGRDALGNPVSMLVGGVPNPDMKYVYDTALDLTWLANWNAAAGTSFDNGGSSSDGRMTPGNAMNWAASLMDFGGGWVLPSVLDTGAPGCQRAYSGTDCGYDVYGSEAGRRAGSPLAHMYYDTLGNKGYRNASGDVQSGSGLSNTGPFSNMGSDVYWSGTAYAPSPTDLAWTFRTDFGDQNGRYRYFDHFAVAVRPGDVFAAPIPEPGGVVLMGLGLAVLGVVRRRRTH